MSNCSNDISYKFDLFMARDDVRRFNEVATSVLLSAGRVALAALAIIATIALVGATVGVLVMAGFFFAEANIPAGIECIVGSISLAIYAAGFAGTVLPYTVVKSIEQCKETHQLIWEN